MRQRDAAHPVPYYPVLLDLAGRRVVVVGAGVVATDKVQGLLPCAPDPLIVVAPECSSVIAAAAATGRLTWESRAYAAGDLEGADYVFAATSDRDVNATVAVEARQRGIPVLAVDDVPNCDFIAPAVVRRGDLLLAVSTGGRSPAMARRTRLWLESVVPAHWGALLDVLGSVRQRLGPVRTHIAPDAWQAAIDDHVEALVADGQLDAAEACLLQRLRPHPGQSA